MKRKAIIIPLVVILALASYYSRFLSRPDKLTIGLFAGNPWSDTNFNIYDVIDDLIEKYQGEYDIEVEYLSGILKEDYSNYLNSLIVSGKEPDVYLILEDDFASLASINALAPLDGYINDDASFNPDDFYPAPLLAGEYENSRYGLPVDCNLDLLFVNETLLAQEGITIAGQLDLDEFYAICQAVTKDTNGDGVVDQFGCCNYGLADVFNAFGIDFFGNGGFQIDLGQTKTAIEYYQQLLALNGNVTTSLDDFDLGNVAFAKLPFSQFRTYRFYPYNLTKYSTFKWDCIDLPGGDSSFGALETLQVGISARCQNKPAAYRFIRMLSADATIQQEYFASSQGISPLRGVVTSSATRQLLNEQSLDVDFDLAVIARGMEDAKALPDVPNYGYYHNQATNLFDGILAGDQDIDLALIDIQKQMRELMIKTAK